MKTLIHSLVLRFAEHRRHKAFVKLALGGNSLPLSFPRREGEKMKSIHLLLSAVLLSAAAPFLEQQQLDQLRTEQQQQFNQLQQQPDPFQRQQLNQLRNEQHLNQLENEHRLNDLDRQQRLNQTR
jgi:hypothetical protein